MPLNRARCSACKEPLGDPPHVAIAMRCPSCRTLRSVALGADGQPADFDASFAANRLLRWFMAARVAMTRGAPGVAIGDCAHCDSPLTISSREPITLPCPHCTHPVEGPAATVLVDQWPEPWARVEGGGLALEYRLAIVDDHTGVTAGCAACGAPTAANDPSMHCRRCNAIAWVEREGLRVQVGVRIDGTRQDLPFNALVPLIQGEQMLRADAATGNSAESGTSLLGVTGVGCALAIGFGVLLIFGIWMAVHFWK